MARRTSMWKQQTSLHPSVNKIFFVQEFIGTLLYYAREVDPSMIELCLVVSSSFFYKNIAFVLSSFHPNHQVSNRRAYLRSEEHIHGSTEELIPEEHIYVSPEEWSVCGPSFFHETNKNKTNIDNESTWRHAALWRNNLPRGLCGFQGIEHISQFSTPRINKLKEIMA